MYRSSFQSGNAFANANSLFSEGHVSVLIMRIPLTLSTYVYNDRHLLTTYLALTVTRYSPYMAFSWVFSASSSLTFSFSLSISACASFSRFSWCLAFCCAAFS